MTIKSAFPGFLTTGFFLFLVSHAIGQKMTTGLTTGPQVLTFFSDVDDTEQPYALYLPPNYTEKNKYPLVIMLHGAGSNHRLALRRVFGKSNGPDETDVEASRYFPQWNDVNYIVAAPYARGTAGYQGLVEQDVYDVLADVKKRYNIDENRIYLTGLSMGGGGTLWLGLSRPDLWAAIAPVCPAPPPGTQDLAPNALNLPVHFFHGEVDATVPVANTREWVQRLKDLGTTVEYTEYPGVNHNSWEKAYQDESIFKWFDKFQRDPFPEHVRLASADYKHGKAYWVQFDELIPDTLATIDAKFTGQNKIEITTSGLSAFTLNLNGHPKFKAGKALQILLDSTSYPLPVTTNSVSFTKQGVRWAAIPYVPAARSKKAGAEGPIREAFASRHIYVYGTLDNPLPEELQARIDTANKAANWSVDRGWFLGRVKFFPRVIADKDVRPSDLESSNLVLFGTKETNSILAKYNDSLPIALQNLAPGFGLFYIFPVGKHYVTVSSGLPWWTSAGTTGWRFLPPAQQLLFGYKDFMFFKGTPKNMIAEGYFDNNWKLPESAVKTFKSSGVVQLK